MAGLNQLQQRQEKWRQERPENSGGTDLYVREGDIVVFHFMSTGEDDDPFFELFYSHEIPPSRQGGYSDYRFCPVDSEVYPDYQCQYCAQDVKTKKRMAMWLYVYDILHTSLREGENFPAIQYQGRTYYRRQVNAPKYWETSAWRNSCFDDIVFLGQQLGNLQANLMNLVVTGQNLSRLYKVHTVPNSAAMTYEVYNAALETCEPVIDILYKQLSTQKTQTYQAPTPVGEVYQPGAPGQTTQTAAAPTRTAPPAPSTRRAPPGRQAAPKPAPAPEEYQPSQAAPEEYQPEAVAPPAPRPATRAPAPAANGPARRAPAPRQVQTQQPLPESEPAAAAPTTPRRRGMF